MTRRRILPRLLAAGVLVLALAGCVRFQADLTLTPEDTVEGRIVVAALLSDDTDESREQALAASSQIESELLGALRDASGITTSVYEQDDYLGTLIELDGVALSAFSGQSEDSLSFARDGDEFVFSGALDFGGEAAPSSDDAEDDGNLTVAITFPGEVSDHNGDLSGTTVTWSTTLDQRLDMSARGSATPAGPPLVLVIAIVVAVLVVIAAAVVLILVLRSRSRARATIPPAVAADPGADPAATPPAVQD
jgi:hypothetical protein